MKASLPAIRETARLRLRPFHPGDVEPYAAMCADPEVMRFLGNGGVMSREDAWRQLAMFAGHWQLRGFGMWAVEERATGAFVGRVGLHYPEGWPDREVGWALARAFWGRGYALEAARAALEEAFAQLGWGRVVSLIDPANARSVRLAERLGEQFREEVTVHGHRVALYALEQSAWRAARPARAAEVHEHTGSRRP
jgi:RimJ/RimL family protein N-acetyltransferase